MDELCEVVELMKCFYSVYDFEKVSDEVNIIFNLVVKGSEVQCQDVMLVMVEYQVSVLVYVLDFVVDE